MAQQRQLLTPLGTLWLLLRHEVEQEWRQKATVGGLLLYAAGAVFICFASIGMQIGMLKGPIWNSLIWIILLFTSLTAIGRSFGTANRGTQLYYYTMVPASTFLVAKMLYNSLMTSALGLLSLLLFSLMIGNPVSNQFHYILTVILGSVSLSGTLTLIAGIVSKASASSTLMPVLSFPLVLPQLLLLIKLSKHALDGLETDFAAQGLWPVLGLMALVVALSYSLFPYIWRS